jgi:hypothetical protein
MQKGRAGWRTSRERRLRATPYWSGFIPYQSGCPNPVWDRSSCPIHDSCQKLCNRLLHRPRTEHLSVRLQKCDFFPGRLTRVPEIAYDQAFQKCSGGPPVSMPHHDCDALSTVAEFGSGVPDRPRRGREDEKRVLTAERFQHAGVDMVREMRVVTNGHANQICPLAFRHRLTDIAFRKMPV